MDDNCYEVLTDLKQEHHIPVRLSDFEAGDEALLTAKANRPMGEYCWTCSSSFIRYVLNHYKEDNCTYIDADMYFYNDPKVLIDEMLAAGKSVVVVPHRFPENKKELAKTVGAYCVEFNTFMNNPESLEVLEYWRDRCLECCSNLGDGVHWGDQKYLEELIEKFDCVHVCENPGAGVAPWNIVSYCLEKDEHNVMYLPKQTIIPIVFYHYQNIAYITRKSVAIGIKKNNSVDLLLVNILYKRYLRRLDDTKKTLSSKYHINILMQGHPAGMHHFKSLKQSWLGQHLLLFLRKCNSSYIIISI